LIEDPQTKNVLLKLETGVGPQQRLNSSEGIDAEERLEKALQDYRSRRLRILVSWFDTAAVALARQVGEGTVVVIGDTEFALNKNLAYLPQNLFNGPYNNAHFWRWLLTDLRGPQAWMPPPPEENDPLAESSKDAPAEAGQSGSGRANTPTSDSDATEPMGREVGP
jgi:hypothetical protein